MLTSRTRQIEPDFSVIVRLGSTPDLFTYFNIFLLHPRNTREKVVDAYRCIFFVAIDPKVFWAIYLANKKWWVTDRGMQYFIL